MKSVQSRREMLRLGALGGIGAAASLGFGSRARAQDGTLYQTEKDHWGWGAAPGQALPEMATNGPWKKLRAVQQKQVFDIHVHCWQTSTQGHSYMEEGRIHEKQVFVNYVDQLIASMDHHGIVRAALNPNFTSYERVRDESYKPHKDRFILSAGWPPERIFAARAAGRQMGNEAAFTPQDLADEYEAQLTRDGAAFIGEDAGAAIVRGLMPRFTMKELHPVIDVILKHDVPIQFHTGWTPSGTAFGANAARPYETASEWAAMFGKFMTNFPDVKVILAHAGGQLDGSEALRLLYSFDNAYCDTAKAPPKIVEAAVRGIGADRVLFGSDWNRPELKEYGPFFMRSAYQHWYNLNTIAIADISDEQREWILHKSAYKLLKMNIV
jgi:predicted TIM-barrel fold metal-dependent hydrolase